MPEPTPPPDAQPPRSRSSADDVHSTETHEMLQRLARSPRLDLDRYAIEGEVDRGGMGAILKIHDRQLNRRLAMKVLLDRDAPRDELERQLAHQILSRFLEEAQVTSQLDHPGVVPVHELGLDQHGKVYFTMRLVKGRTAREVFGESHGGSSEWPLTRALEVILRVCDTMSFAHDKGVLHRDLKPDNVMVGRFGEVYVMDWGLAKVRGQDDRRDLRIRPEPAEQYSQVDSARMRDAERDERSSVVSMDGQKLGTPSYMPPEQARGEELDERADVYAIGAMLYHLLTGRAPYTTPGVKKPAYRILEDVADGPPKAIEELQKGVPAELVAIAGKAMARDRAVRYASTALLAADVRAFLAMHAVQAYRTGALVELQLWIKRNKPLAASLVAAVLILVAGVVVASTLANENASLAAAESRAKGNAQRTVSHFNQLAAVVRLQDVIAAQDSLWPAGPDRIPALQAWLEKDCRQLLQMRPTIEATLAELRQKALPSTSEQIEADRITSPAWAQFDRQRQLVASLRRAQALYSGGLRLELPGMPPALRDAEPARLNAFAWSRVAPDTGGRKNPSRTVFGDEATALVAARMAVAKTAGQQGEHQFLDTLAWAALANGLYDEAKRHSADALAKAPAEARDEHAGRLRAIEAAVADAGPRLAAAEAALSALEAQVAEHRTWEFAADAEGESARFLHDALSTVLAGFTNLEAREQRDVERRLAFAQQVHTATFDHPRAGATWSAARAAIAKADGVVASKQYAGQSIPLPDDAVLGLVPIGMNPVTTLWEFYDLRSAWDGTQLVTTIEIPRHQPNGSIDVQDGTGIVFVLLPGGRATLGSQSNDPQAPFHDPRRDAHEPLHEVTLAPFLLARHELTQGQWARLWTWDEALRKPSSYRAGQRNAGEEITLANPVEQVDWQMANRVLTRHGMILPTEAQWEYGCRGGTTTPWIVPLAELKTVANVADALAMRVVRGWTCETWEDGHIAHAPVGSFAPNPLGLHDVHGNVWEWTRDLYSDYGSERTGDGARPPGSTSRGYSIRGGCFSLPAVSARSALRSSMQPRIRNHDLGLRAARQLPE